MAKYPLPEIKYMPGGTACFIKNGTIIMAKVNLTYYDTGERQYKFLLDKFSREFTEAELFDSFHDASKFMEKKNDN